MNSGQHEQSPKVAPTVAIDERAEFEKWANKHKGGEPLQLGGGGTYTNPFANAAYEAWQAARKLPAPVLADETKKLYEELIYSVASKFPDETRHQTALRYIRNAEKGTSEKADQTRLQFSMLKSSPVSYSANASDAPQVSQQPASDEPVAFEGRCSPDCHAKPSEEKDICYNAACPISPRSVFKRIGELEKRLEVDDKAKDWDGIACRDVTIRELEKELKELRTKLQQQQPASVPDEKLPLPQAPTAEGATSPEVE